VSAELNERQRFALLWLSNLTEPGEDLFGGRGQFAWRLGESLKAAGLLDDRGKRHGASQGAGNILSALRRRGLVANSTPGGEAFQAVEWGITKEGRELARKLEAKAADVEAISLAWEAATGADSISTIESVYERTESGAYVCIQPGCEAQEHSAEAMWRHVHGSHGREDLPPADFDPGPWL
jgi:hypothetical protein